ncbi:Uncharacterised protein [Legionella busanensis]|uniref:Uncharacterized protein n=1 Tax=Legionella busanensis TaxID=190655 RepID=A0A378JJL9_9GAMM|nr:hypothetical protein [Legionella busanensis]STX50409.1 Uncharacterised protein [Legionella busanensis]
MQKNDKKVEEKAANTSKLLGLVNLIITPLYALDTKVGLTVTLTANAFLLSYLHELGKRRRPGSNTINKINTFFSSQAKTESLEVENALRNIVNGGDAVYNEVLTKFTT